MLEGVYGGDGLFLWGVKCDENGTHDTLEATNPPEESKSLFEEIV